MEKREHTEFQNFFRRCFPKVKNFAMMLLKSEDEAEDVAQDIFCRLWQQPEIWLGKGDGVDRYLFVMAKNAILNIFRHQQVHTDFEEYARDRAIFAELIGNKPLDDIYYDEKVLMLELALERMPAKRRRIFIMSRFEELGNREIAEKLGISVRTVEHQIYLALCELRKVLLVLFPFIVAIR